MGDGSSFDFAYIVSISIVVVAMLAIAIKLLPVLVDVVWQIFPSVVILMLIAGVLRGMLKRFFD